MPFPNEHACRIKPPGSFQKESFRRIKQGKLSIIIGRLLGKTTTTTQAFRYPTDSWTEDQARNHCKDEGGSFEAAKKDALPDDIQELETSERQFRLDSFKKDKYEITNQGFLKAESLATKVGVFEYRHPDGSVTREFRSPEEVFDQESMDSLKMVPITRNHPPGMIDIKNLKKYQVGFTGEIVEQRGDHVGCTVLITDEDEVKSIVNEFNTTGMTDEVSLGYKCDVIPEAGEWNGETYDHIQRNIRYNHYSLLDGQGRAGRDARLRLDQEPKEDITMFRFKKDKVEVPGLHMDAVDVEIPDEATQTVEKLSEKLDEAVGIIDYLAKMGDAIQARYDALIEEIETIKKDLEDLADQLKVEHKDKDDKTLKLDIIKTVSKDFDPKDKSDEYIQARFDTIREAVEKTDSGDESMKNFLKNAEAIKQDAKEPKDPRQDFINQSQGLHKEKPPEQPEAK
jgi:hypothetical protein